MVIVLETYVVYESHRLAHTCMLFIVVSKLVFINRVESAVLCGVFIITKPFSLLMGW